MSPTLAPLLTVLSRAGIDTAIVPEAFRPVRQHLYAVIESGDFGGRRYAVGEVVVCRGEATNTEPVVLVPRGPGRPMLGRVVGEALTGDAGEPCAPARWTVAGRIERVLGGSNPVTDACVRFARTGRIVSMATSRGERAERSGGGAASTPALGAAADGWGTRSSPSQSADQLPLFGVRAA